MSVPSGEVDIVNMALGFIGSSRVNSISNPVSELETICARHYDDARQNVLREGVWNFAKKRASISRTGTPEFDFTDAYALPNDFVRLLSVGGDTEVLQEQYYDIQQNKQLLIDYNGASSIKIRYIADQTDVAKWDAKFKKCVALQLAVDLAYQVTKSIDVFKMVNAMLLSEMPSAIAIDGQEKPPERIQRSKFLAARRHGPRSGQENPLFFREPN